MYLLIISYSLISINFINNFLHILKYLLPFSLVLVLLSIVNGGENIKKLLLGLFVLVLMIANVSAVDEAGNSAVISDSENAEEPDIPDLYFEDDFNVTSDNINKYFPNGVLASNYSNCNLTFSGEFNNLGVLSISQKLFWMWPKAILFCLTCPLF